MRINLVGQRFGLLTVEALDGVRAKRYPWWICLCDCGRKVTVRGDRLRFGLKKFCQYKYHPREKTGVTVTHRLTYSSWNSAWKRAKDTKGKNWRNYGSRGITVCERWENFKSFLEDMGERPSMAHSLDRIDNDRGYEPGNCRWATKSEQRRNSRGAVWVEFEGQRFRLADFCEAKGMSYSVLKGRLSNGWPLELAMVAHKGYRFNKK